MAQRAAHTRSRAGHRESAEQAPAGGTPEPIAWSFTRRQTAERCARQYWWQYRGTKGGAYAPQGSLRRRAWALKLSTSLPLLVGTVVHNAARQVVAAVRDGQAVPDAAELYADARLPLLHAYHTSTKHLERYWAMPAVYPALREVLARGEVTPMELARARDRLERCLSHLASAPVWEDLETCRPGEIVLSDAIAESCLLTPDPERPLAPGEDGQSQEVLVALDLAYRHHDPATADGLLESPTWVVLDWKTGPVSDEDARLQLAAYGLFLRSRGVPLTDGAYVARLVNLAAGSEWLELVGEHELRWVVGVIDEDVQRLRTLHAVPAPPADAPPCPDRFPYAASPGRSCPSCAFLTLCTEELGRRPWERPATTSPDRSVSVTAAAGPTGTPAQGSLSGVATAPDALGEGTNEEAL